MHAKYYLAVGATVPIFDLKNILVARWGDLARRWARPISPYARSYFRIFFARARISAHASTRLASDPVSAMSISSETPSIVATARMRGLT